MLKSKVNHCTVYFVLRNQQLVFIFGAVKKILPYTAILLFFFMQRANAQFETSRDSVVQLYGVIMTADSLVGIPAVSVMVKGQNRGTISNAQGVFSIVVLKGDQVEFTHVTYKPKTISIPRNLEGNQYSVVQLMVIDTVYLPATIIKPRPTKEQFARDFVNNKVPDDDIEIARQNTSAAKRRALIQSTPADGGEATRIQMNKIATKATYQGQTPPQNIFNPAAWAEFINAWKRGDFKNKNIP
ncbi:MAG: carboxypeptidase-like regulatory domain-containing protein [Sphingobacteriales bacterium]|nr:carboxypeptidase-like regulatory domain-containing protein [Sphingobacteriales bacterium]